MRPHETRLPGRARRRKGQLLMQIQGSTQPCLSAIASVRLLIRERERACSDGPVIQSHPWQRWAPRADRPQRSMFELEHRTHAATRTGQRYA